MNHARAARKSSPMANIDFIVVPLGRYLKNHIEFGMKLKNCPKVFTTNYFLKHEGRYTNEILDKKVWIIWAEGRVHEDYGAIRTPIGYLPKYKDINKLFKHVFNRNYTRKEYEIQFSLRVDKYLEKIARMENIFKPELNMPIEFWQVLNQQKSKLEIIRRKTGKPVLSPSYFA